MGNIGNAFIDYGSMASIKEALDCEVMVGSKFPQQALLNQELEIELKDKTYKYGLKESIFGNIHIPIRKVFLGRVLFI